MKNLRGYQIQSLGASERDPSFLDASDLGTGKTLVAVERLRRIQPKGPVHRVLVVAPVNTHQQWVSAFAEQYPTLSDSPYLRSIGTHRSDPESWDLMTSRKPGVYIIGWEAMRGQVPYEITLITQEASERREKAQQEARKAKKILQRKRSSDEEKTVAQTALERAEQEKVIHPHEQSTTASHVPEGWVPKETGGASRGYGALYKNRTGLTQKAVKEAMKCGDVPPWSRTGTWDLIIADEVHRISRRDSINAFVLKLINAEHRHGASATPAGNKPQGLWSVLNWLWKKEYRSFWQWANTFLLIENKIIGSGGQSVQQIVGERDPGVTWLDIPSKIRHKVVDVRGELPDVIERTVIVPMSSSQRKIYDQFADQCVAWLDYHTPGEDSVQQKLIVTPLGITQRIRLRQAALGTLVVTEDDPVEIGFDAEASQVKIDMIKEIISDLPPEEPVLIWTHSRKWALLCRDALRKAKIGKVNAWTGATPTKTRQTYKETFGVDFRIIVAQIHSLAEGVDGLQLRCATEIWASVLDGDEETGNAQARGRLHRDGQTRPVQRWYIHSENSIDTDLAESLAERRAQMRAMYRDKNSLR